MKLVAQALSQSIVEINHDITATDQVKGSSEIQWVLEIDLDEFNLFAEA